MRPVELWEGWSFDGTYILDSGGNKYSLDDIRAAFYGKELYREIAGNSRKVYSLKQELEKRLQSLSPPEIFIRYGDGKEKIVSYS